MQPDQILAAVADFKNCLERMWPDAARRGISRASFDAHTAQLEPDVKIMDFVDAQPEFTRAFWEYLDLLVTDERLAKGREILAQHANAFAAAERAYGVDRHIIAAIWGIETKYGAVPGDRPVIRSTATLACVGRGRLLQGRVSRGAGNPAPRRHSPGQLKARGQGAFGLTQFMPTAFKRYAIDFDGDGRRDVVGSVPDVIASTANHLVKAGWVSGQTWGFEVALPQGLQLHAGRSGAPADACRMGAPRRAARRRGGLSETRHARLLVRSGGLARACIPDARQFPRHHEIQSGGSVRARDRPLRGPAARRRSDRAKLAARGRVLSRAERLEFQQHLNRLGFDVGEPNGRFGNKTRIAVRDFQARSGLVPDGFATAAILERLRTR
jgi:lytic murein transglycosylase